MQEKKNRVWLITRVQFRFQLLNVHVFKLHISLLHISRTSYQRRRHEGKDGGERDKTFPLCSDVFEALKFLFFRELNRNFHFAPRYLIAKCARCSRDTCLHDDGDGKELAQ
jgi:hypothetical protein